MNVTFYVYMPNLIKLSSVEKKNESHCVRLLLHIQFVSLYCVLFFHFTSFFFSRNVDLLVRSFLSLLDNALCDFYRFIIKIIS